MLLRNGKVIAVAAIAGVMATSTAALGFGEGQPADGGARNPSPDERRTYTKETEIIANVPTYGTRQSNKSASGGGAIYGCRAVAATNGRSCLRASNLTTGQAFQFATNGVDAGAITSSKAGDQSRPLTTNMTGVATGLNADRVDSKSASDLTADAVAGSRALHPAAQVASNGTPGELRGVEKDGTSRQNTGDYNVKFSGDLSKCTLSATVTGTAAGQVTVTPSVAADKKTTDVDVRTFSGAGAAADRGFHLTGNC